MKNPHPLPLRAFDTPTLSAPVSFTRTRIAQNPDIDGFCRLMQRRFDEAQIDEVRSAYELAEQAHTGQSRVSGEPYISHPLAVARIVFELNMDHRSVMAALLHDVVEDTSVSIEQITCLLYTSPSPRD